MGVEDGGGSIASEDRLLLGCLLAPMLGVLSLDDDFLLIGVQVVITPAAVGSMDLRKVVDTRFQDDRGAAVERVQIVCQRHHVARLDGDRRSGHT